MNNKNIVKKDLLRRKIQEHFSKNPKSKVLLVKADLGESKTLWKVVREGCNFKVTEVNTTKEEFVFESGVAVVQEASVDFSNISRLFVQAMTPPFDHAKLSNALKTANMSVAKIVDPNEKNQVGSMIGALTNMVDDTTAGGGSKVQMQSTTPGARPVSTMQTASKKNSGKVLKEEEEKSSTEKKTKKKVDSEKTAAQKLDPSKEDENDVGLETDVSDQQPDENAPIKQPSSEEMVVSKNLTGQTIKAANIKITPDGGELTLDLISSEVPSKLQWLKSGKVVFYANDRPYIINKE